MVVEEEQINIILRVFNQDNDRIFSCTVISSGPTTARVVDANGKFNVVVAKALAHWMDKKGYTEFTFERSPTLIKSFEVKNCL